MFLYNFAKCQIFFDLLTKCQKNISVRFFVFICRNVIRMLLSDYLCQKFNKIFNMESEYSRLKDLVPFNINSLKINTIQELTEVKNMIMKKQRHIILLHLYNSEIYPHFYPSNKDEFYDFIDQDINSNPLEANPEIKNFLSKIYDHLLNNPSDLVTLTISASNIFDSSNLASFHYSTIPSIFGYFSSYEHIAFGYRFYCQLLQKAQHRVFFTTVVPFFRNATTFRYIESVSESLIELFCKDMQILTSETLGSIISEISDNLHDIIIKYLNLLPKTHLNLLILMFNNKYSRHDIYEFFVSQFIQPEVSGYLKSSAYSSHIRTFNTICEYLLTAADKSDFEELLKSNSLIDIPSMFGDFGQKHIDLLVTSLDGSILSTIIRSIGAVSKSLEAVGNDMPLAMSGYSPFLIRVQPCLPLHPVSAIGGKIFFEGERIKTHNALIPRFSYMKNYFASKKFTNFSQSLLNDKELDQTKLCPACKEKLANGVRIDECSNCGGRNNNTLTFEEYIRETNYDEMFDASEDFESIIERKLCIDLLKQFLSTVERALSDSLAVHAENLIDTFLANSDQSEVINSSASFLKKFTLLDNQRDCIIFFAARAESLMAMISASRLKGDLNDLEVKFTEVASLSATKLPTPFVKNENQSRKLFLNKKLFEIASAFANVKIQPFTKRFFYITKILEQLDELKKLAGAESSLIPGVLKVCVEPGIISTILKCIAMLMKKNYFVALLDKNDKELWGELENEIVQLVSKDEEALLMWTRLIDALVNAF